MNQESQISWNEDQSLNLDSKVLVKNLNNDLVTEINEIDSRVDGIEKNLTNINTYIDNKIGEAKTELEDEIDEKTKDFVTSTQVDAKIASANSDIESTLTSIDGKVDKLLPTSTFNSNINNLSNSITALNTLINNLSYYSRIPSAQVKPSNGSSLSSNGITTGTGTLTSNNILSYSATKYQNVGTLFTCTSNSTYNKIKFEFDIAYGFRSLNNPIDQFLTLYVRNSLSQDKPENYIELEKIQTQYASQENTSQSNIFMTWVDHVQTKEAIPIIADTYYLYVNYKEGSNSFYFTDPLNPTYSSLEPSATKYMKNRNFMLIHV